MRKLDRKIYLVKRGNHSNKTRYDEALGYVCISDNAKEARKMGTEIQGDQSPDVWKLDSTKVSIIGYTNKEKGIVIIDYNAG